MGSYTDYGLLTTDLSPITPHCLSRALCANYSHRYEIDNTHQQAEPFRALALAIPNPLCVNH